MESFAKMMMSDLNENLEFLQNETKDMVIAGVIRANNVIVFFFFLLFPYHWHVKKILPSK